MARFCRDQGPAFVAVEADEIERGRSEGVVFVALARLDLFTCTFEYLVFERLLFI